MKVVLMVLGIIILVAAIIMAALSMTAGLIYLGFALLDFKLAFTHCMGIALISWAIGGSFRTVTYNKK